MVQKMAAALVNQMEEEQLLNGNMKAYYIYALVIMAERWLTVGSIIGISLLWKKLVPTILFLLFFLSLRKRTGGYHAKEFWQCYLSTIATYLAIVWICPVLTHNPGILYGMVLVSAIFICRIGTVNHPNMDMDNAELEESKKSARYLLGMEFFIITVSVLLHIDYLCIGYMSIAIIVCAVLMCIAKIVKQEVR